jgi:transcriptional regulator GlxA family with amidase domain
MAEYLKGVRLQRARELLELSLMQNLTVTDISFQCGFSDTAHFSKSFKRAFGISPRDVQRRH